MFKLKYRNNKNPIPNVTIFENKDLTLKPTVDDKKLYSYLFSPSIDEKNEIDSTIDMFLMD